MKFKTATITVIAVALCMVSGMAFGQAKKKPAATKTVACPVCKMPLSAKKDKDHTTAVRLKKGGPVMYCCAGCKMPDSVLVKAKPGKMSKMMKKKA